MCPRRRAAGRRAADTVVIMDGSTHETSPLSHPPDRCPSGLVRSPLRSATFALLAPLDKIVEETLTLLFAARCIHPKAATQELVELTTRSQSLPITRQPVFGRLETRPADKRRR